jgi:aspartate/methionine/tyrosine aminotransferase
VTLVEAPNTLRPVRDELFDWILSLGPTSKYNLTASGLSEPDLRAMGIDTSFEKFAAENDEHERIFAEEVARLYGVEPENVMLTNGGSEAIFLAYSVLGRGGRAAVPLPNYPPMFTVPRSLGMKVQASPAAKAWASGSMFGLTDPNNPTGRILDESAVETLVDSAKSGSVIYINETYREFTFPGSPRTYFGQANNIVTSNTMTKFFGLGRLRVGWILADERKARQLLYAKWAVSGHDSSYSLWITTQVLKRRFKFVERARQIYSRNVKLVRRFLEETKGVSAELGAAPFCLVHYKGRPDSVAFAREVLDKTGVLIAPGDFFGAPRAFRLCFTTDEGTLKRGLGALSEFFKKRSS